MGINWNENKKGYIEYKFYTDNHFKTNISIISLYHNEITKINLLNNKNNYSQIEGFIIINNKEFKILKNNKIKILNWIRKNYVDEITFYFIIKTSLMYQPNWDWTAPTNLWWQKEIIKHKNTRKININKKNEKKNIKNS